MANIENLKPGEYKLSQEEAKKGGINSGIARREKATMRKTLELLLDEVAKVEGNEEKLTYKQLATLGLLKGAISGNATNYRTILETLGEIMTDNTSFTPNIEINVIDNSNLEKTLYEENRHNKDVKE